MTDPTWRVDLTEPDGTEVLTELADVNVELVAWELDQPDEYVVSFPKDFGDAADVQELRELKIIDLLPDDPVCRAWGPMLQFTTDGARGDVEVEGRGPLWYFTRLDLDAIPLERLTNPSFEDSGGSLDDWTAHGVTSEASTDHHIRGDFSAKLTQAVAGVDTFLWQDWTETATGVGTLLTASAYVWISPDDYGGPAFDNRGLQLAAYDPDTGALQRVADAAITDSTPKGKWVRLQTTLQLPPDVTWRVQASLYSPAGITYWDDAEVLLMGSVSTAGITGTVDGAADAAAFMELIVAFEQGAGVSTKPDLNVGTDCPDCGTGVTRHYQWVEHHACWDYIEEMTSRDDGFDVAVDIDDSTTRTFRTYAPTKGSDKSADVVLELITRDPTSGEVTGGNVVSFDLSTNGSDSETWVTYQGDGDGVTRAQAIAMDQGILEGVALQRVVQAPDGTTLDGLDAAAIKRVRRYRAPARSFQPVCTPELLDQIVVGDIVGASISQGWVSLTGKWRVLRIELNGRTRLLTLTLDKVVAS